MRNDFFSISSAAALLERDRQTVTRALRNVPADAHENKKPRWRLRTIVDALARHEASTGRVVASKDNPLMHLADQIEAAWEEFDGIIAKLKAEPDVERRRAMCHGANPIITRLDDLMTTANAANKETGTIMQLASERMIGDAISQVVELLELWPEVEAAKTALRT
jgi:hypothetical protein